MYDDQVDEVIEGLFFLFGDEGEIPSDLSEILALAQEENQSSLASFIETCLELPRKKASKKYNRMYAHYRSRFL